MNSASPMPRSLPRRLASRRRAGNLSQSAACSAVESSVAASAQSYVKAVGVLYGKALFGSMFLRRSLTRSMPVIRAASSTSRSQR